jgi:hypothetical protein
MILVALEANRPASEVIEWIATAERTLAIARAEVATRREKKR